MLCASGAKELVLDLDSAGPGGLETRLSQLCRWVLDADRDGVRYGLSLPGTTIEAANRRGKYLLLPLDSGDVNGDGMVDVGDAIYLLSYQFSDGPEPPAPFPNPGCP